MEIRRSSGAARRSSSTPMGSKRARNSPAVSYVSRPVKLRAMDARQSAGIAPHGGSMKHRIMASIAAILVVAASAARAEYHTFQIEQIFSNANGTVQFVVMHEMFGQDGENLWMGNPLNSSYTGGSQTFTFNKN